MTVPIDKWERTANRKNSRKPIRGLRGLCSQKTGLAGLLVTSAQWSPCCSEALRGGGDGQRHLYFEELPVGILGRLSCHLRVFRFTLPPSRLRTASGLHREVPSKIRTCNLSASGPRLFVFQTEGDGWDQFAFPFLTLYFWMRVYLNTYTNVHVDLLTQAVQSIRTLTYGALGTSLCWGQACGFGARSCCNFG